MKGIRILSLISLILSLHIIVCSQEKDITRKEKFKIIKSDDKSYAYYILSYSSYLLIIDSYGYPIFKRDVSGSNNNFKMHEKGSFSYYDNVVHGYIFLDSLFNNIDTVTIVGDYDTDFHDIKVDENNNYYLIGRKYNVIDLTDIVEGGQENSTVVSSIIQKLDVNKNVLFEWNSLDYSDITESYDDYVDLKSNYIDYFHANSIDFDLDNDIYISSRHLNQVIKINEDGDVIWRLGGKRNDFDLINDSFLFSGQHSIQVLNDSMIYLFDNGNTFHPEFSRGVLYKVDNEKKTLELLEEYKITPENYSKMMGSISESYDGNVIVGWGVNSNNLLYSEFDKNGNLIKTVHSDSLLNYSYSIFKTDWVHRVFSVEQDSLNFDTVFYGNNKSIQVQIRNNLDKEIIINSFSYSNPSFNINADFPIVISANGSIPIELEFKPTINSAENRDVLYLNCTTDQPYFQQISTPIFLQGYSPDESKPIISVYPESGSTNIATDTVILITSNEPLRLIDNSIITTESIKNIIKITDASNPEINLNYDVSISSNQDSIFIYPLELNNNTQYCIVIENLLEDFSDNAISSIDVCFMTENVSNLHEIKQNDLMIYPNPTNGIFFVKSNGIKKIKIYDSSGILINVKSIKTYEKVIEFRLRDNSKGVFIVEVEYKNGVKTFKKITHL